MATISPLASSPAQNHSQIPMSLDRQQSPVGTMNSNHRTSGYFPQTHTSQPDILSSTAHDQTLTNTLANSHAANHQSHFSQAAPGPSLVPKHAPVFTGQGKFTEEWDASQRGSSIIDGPVLAGNMQRSNSFASNSGEDHLSLPSRRGTLKKKASLRRSGSLKRSGSRRSMNAGSVRSLALQSTSDPDEAHSAFHCPVPTTGNPTEVLAGRFQSWRKILKDLITYYREIQNHYEQKSKSLLKLANVANNISNPPGFLTSGGLDDALQILRNYNKQAVIEANKAREIEEDVILALTGLRSDIHQKIKEIKNLSGDFKNSVEKEMDSTRRLVKTLQEALGQSELDSSLTTGKQDPYLLRLAVDKQVERQIDEENYLHQAYLNLESSGRELESIVVGEIQKAYNAYAGILKRESDAAYSAIEELRAGPVTMPKDHEWVYFVQKDDHFIDPEIPIRSAEHIHYPGRDHPSSQEIRAGLLERKSKYLKSYTAGWYVLSPTHLHEFKSADKAQAPVMSLYLPEQKLGSHSTGGGSSNKFILKGRQTGSMHRGHTWVFRAESHDTMMAWYEDIKALTEKTPQERSDFVRGHSRSLSQSSRRSISSDGVVDEDDEEPYAADATVSISAGSKADVRRPQPGGRFPSDIQVNAQRGLQAPLSPSSVSSELVDVQDRETIAAAGALPGSRVGENSYMSREPRYGYGNSQQTPMEEVPSHGLIISQQAREDGVNPYTSEPLRRSLSESRGPQTLNMPSNEMRRSQSSQPASVGYVDDAPAVTTASFRQEPFSTLAENAQHSDWRDDTQKMSPNGSTNGTYAAAGGHITGGDTTRTPLETGNGFAPQSGYYTQVVEPVDAGRNSAPIPVVGQKQQNSPVRPVSGTVRTDSVPTISNLHVPGEYPKGTPTAEGFGK